MIAIIDYGAGNIFSVKNALDYLGLESRLTADPAELEAADGRILPGVGAFPWAVKKLNESGLVDTIKAQAKVKPFMGICLGMQLLFDKSFEFEECKGLGLVRGYVDKIPDAGLVIPHMGWNALHFTEPKHPLFKYLDEGDFGYFVHSYSAVGCEDSIIASSEYGGTVTAACANGNVYGCQFHPEKSGTTGLNILKAFAEL